MYRSFLIIYTLCIHRYILIIYTLCIHRYILISNVSGLDDLLSIYNLQIGRYEWSVSLHVRVGGLMEALRAVSLPQEGFV